MKKLVFAVATVGLLGGCATSGGPEMVECLQPDRRVVVEVVGTRVTPAPKPAPDKPAAKPTTTPVELAMSFQGNTVFDYKSSALKDSGKAEIDDFLKTDVMGKQPVTISSVIVTGHSDKLESGKDEVALSEARAKTVTDYLVSKSVKQDLIFWEGRASRQPVAVTKFCS